MNDTAKMLIDRKNYLGNVKRLLDSKYANLPPGKLYIIKRGGKYYFYIRNHKLSGQLIYIKKKNAKLISGLMQKKYVDQMREAIDNESEAIDLFLTHMPATVVEDVYNGIDLEIRESIDPVIDNDIRFAMRWAEGNAITVDTSDESTGIKTDRGERVKSKSECLIANMLNKNGILYKYEKELHVGKYVFHPDFTILDVKNRREIYYEHFGMMDDDKYLNDAIRKLNIYNRNGFSVGDRLLISMETSTQPLDIQAAEKMVLKALGM